MSQRLDAKPAPGRESSVAVTGVPANRNTSMPVRTPDLHSTPQQRLLLGAIIAVLAGIFLFDLNMPLGIAGGVPYVFALLLCLGLRQSGAIVLCGALASALIVIGYLLSPAPSAANDFASVAVLSNRALALFAVWVTAVLGYRQRRAADQSAADRRFIGAILDTAVALVVVVDRAGRIVRCNAACEGLIQTDGARLMGKALWEFMPEERQQPFRKRIKRAWDRNEACRIEQPLRAASGELRLIAWSNTPLLNPDGSVRYMVCTGVDVSDERAALERARRMQNEFYRIGRAYELGGMTSAISHELVQPLTAVSNYLRLAERLLRQNDADSAERVPGLLNDARQQAEHGARIIQRLRELMSRGESEMSRIDINATIRAACKLALLDADDHGIEVRMVLADDLPEVQADATQIQQVVINLARNGIEALRETPRRQLEIRSLPGPEGGTEVRVADTGPGLPTTVAENLFQPFHSTKPHGMGIGLTICRSIINAHGGRIWTEPLTEGGTVFAFTLPPATRPETAGD